MNQNLIDAVNAYVEAARNVSNSNGDFQIQWLKRYVRVSRDGSAHSFIDIETGDILKAAGWAKPAKHARGSIYAPDHGASCLGPYGPHYLRA